MADENAERLEAGSGDAQGETPPAAAADPTSTADGPTPQTVHSAPDVTESVSEPDEPAMWKSSPADEAGEADEPIVPGSLRVDPQVGREMFGALYTGITSYGPAMYGNHNKIVTNIGEQPPEPVFAPLDYVSDLLETYAPTGSDGELVELLTRRAVVCLVGAKNSGRFSSACVALAGIYDEKPVHEITLPAGATLDAVLHDRDQVLEECGFVLRYARDDYADAMRRLADLFRRRRSRLLLIRDVRATGGTRHGADVDHQPPDPIEVFRRHLTRRLNPTDPATKDYLEAPAIRSALAKTYGPKESVAMAEAIAVEQPVGEEALRAVLDRSQPRRRELAAQILIPPGGAGVRARRASQHERAFRISYAVFRRQPLHYVFEAAEWLLAEIDSAALRPEWGAMALQRSVDELLGEPLAEDWRAGRDAGTVVGTSRVAWMRDPGLRGAILDVAWHEFDGTRKPLLRWLDRLVNDGDLVMSRAAAETAGLLSHYDFDRVHDELVEHWAGSPKRRMRQAAAWSETTAEMAGDVGDLIRERLRRWCSGGTNYRRDAAALVYASGLQQPVLAWSMRDLGLIADNPMQSRSYAVAEAVNQLYQPEAAQWLVKELAGWTSRKQARVHAARALVVLAEHPSTDAADPRPELLAQLAGGHVVPDDLALLWRAALGDPALVGAGTRTLAGWLRVADGDAGLRVRVEELLSLVAPRPVMRRRVAYYLKRQPEFRDGLPEWVEHERRPES